MGTFVYNPGVQVFIQTLKHGIVDVSDDLTSGVLQRVVDDPSTFRFTLQNTARKFDSPAPIFTPNDRVIVNMKRTKWVRVFTGYLNEVPVFSVWPRDVTLTASCSLKKLQYWYWDANVLQTFTLLNNALNAARGTTDPDGGLKGMAIAVLDQVSGWPKDRIHIGAIPAKWFEAINPYLQQVINEVVKANEMTSAYMASVGASATVGGTSLGDGTFPTGDLGALMHAISDIESSTSGGYSAWNHSTNALGKYQILLSNLNTRNGWAQEVLGHVITDPQEFINNHAEQDQIASAKLGQYLQKYGPRGAAFQWNHANWYADEVMAKFNIYRTSNGTSTRPNVPAAGSKGWVDPLPGGVLSQHYGGPEPHLGTDIAAPARTQVHAASSGVVTYAGPASGFGPNMVQIGHGSFTTGYGHMIVRTVQTGQTVTAGQVIGGVGNEGHSHGFHLHFEVRTGQGAQGSFYAGPTVDPEPFMRGNGVTLGSGGNSTGTVDGNGVTGAGASGATTTTDPNAPPDWNKALIASDAVGNNAIDKLFQTQSTLVALNSDTSGQMYWGIRALMNDNPLLPYVKNLMNSSMRQMCSGPNGDIIAWFPDYFGQWGTAATLVISDIELRDFSVKWSDEYLKTHVFATGAYQTALDPSQGTLNASLPDPDIYTSGIASIEIPTLVAALYGIDPKTFDHAAWLTFMLQRFGARSESLHFQGTHGPRGEFFLALYEFMQMWANQYIAEVPVTFMPEAWPGMIMKLPQYDFKAYIQAVQHTFKFGPGGSFETSITITAPSKLGKSNRILFGLPVVPEVNLNNTDDLGSETLSGLNIANQNQGANGDTAHD